MKSKYVIEVRDGETGELIHATWRETQEEADNASKSLRIAHSRGDRRALVKVRLADASIS